ncbi:hypothetical protein [uncultured Thalassospira sp.]|uniref:hypothetical protein n=1 Tax=uncultured Thalassospira sp. TaxID=404382 RepID=UPI0032B16227|tara:strand:+ start:83 stop:1165 length:1083 start_codon:yes stop_codon:yes gene_type:complete
MREAKNTLFYFDDPGVANFAGPEFIMSPVSQKVFPATFCGPQHVCRYLWNTKGLDCIRVTEQTDFSSLLSRFSRLVLGTGENVAGVLPKIFESALKLGLEMVALVDAPTSLRERFGCFGRDVIPNLSSVLYSDFSCTDHLLSFGFSEEQLQLVRNPQLDYVENFVQRRRQIRGLSGSPIRKLPHKKILFVSEISDGLDPSDFKKNPAYTLTGHCEQTTLRTLVVLEEVILALKRIEQRYSLVVRLHPKDKAENYSSVESEVDYFSVKEHPLEAISDADFVLGMTSSLLSEAAVLQKPVLSVVPRSIEANWLGQFVKPPVDCVWTRENLRASLQKLLENKMRPTQRLDKNFPSVYSVLQGI